MKAIPAGLSWRLDELIHISRASEMLLNDSYYYWYYRWGFYLDWLFQHGRGFVSTFNMKYVCTKLSLKICIYCSLPPSFLFLLFPLSFLFWGRGLLYSPSWPSKLRWPHFLYILSDYFCHMETYMGAREMAQQLVHTLPERTRGSQHHHGVACIACNPSFRGLFTSPRASALTLTILCHTWWHT